MKTGWREVGRQRKREGEGEGNAMKRERKNRRGETGRVGGKMKISWKKKDNREKV